MLAVRAIQGRYFYVRRETDVGPAGLAGVDGTVFSSIAADVIGALLAVKGILPMGSVAAWVYGGWALGAFLGVRVAVRGRSGTVQASLLLAAGAYVLIWLVGLTVFGTAAFAHHGLGITLAVVAGALLGAVLGQGRRHRKKKPVRRGRQHRGTI